MIFRLLRLFISLRGRSHYNNGQFANDTIAACNDTADDLLWRFFLSNWKLEAIDPFDDLT